MFTLFLEGTPFLSQLILINRVISGYETLDAMEKVDVDNKDRPIKDIFIKSITIHANPIAENQK